MPRLWVSRPLQMISRDFRGFLSRKIPAMAFCMFRGAVKTLSFVRKWIQVKTWMSVIGFWSFSIFFDDQFAIRKIWQNRSKRHFTAHLSRTHLVVFTRKTWGQACRMSCKVSKNPTPQAWSQDRTHFAFRFLDLLPVSVAVSLPISKCVCYVSPPFPTEPQKVPPAAALPLPRAETLRWSLHHEKRWKKRWVSAGFR